MDSPSPLTWPHKQRNFLYLLKKNQFSKRKTFSHILERTNFLAVEKKLLCLPEKITNFLFLPKKADFSNEKVFHTCLIKPILHPKKELLMLTRKITNFLCGKSSCTCPKNKQIFQKKNSYNYRKKQFCKRILIFV